MRKSPVYSACKVALYGLYEKSPIEGQANQKLVKSGVYELQMSTLNRFLPSITDAQVFPYRA